ncbi:MAG TPA: SDR family NAD(P)-dependent oxidoreductase [Acidimicrobiales bacterium]|nr:SDR family NAD(P)-dependent oxidoreductase [Acidimicrobiales bacterium]
MDDLIGRTAVVTGAASGIGFGLAERFAAEGMRVVLADVEQGALAAAAESLAAGGAEVLPVVTDVADAESVGALADAAYERFGSVHVLCNNAGVGSGGLIAELSLADWQWVLGVNLWGVINGLHAFLPRMLAGGEPGHVVNTASLAGHVAGPFMGPYSASKFAVVAISESLYHEMNMQGGAIGVSVLCPGWVNTNIHSSERNRPPALGGGAGRADDGRADMLKQMLATGMPPAEVASLVLQAIREDHFYVLTHPDMTPAVETRMKAIVEGANPALQMIG